jgi:hypothetical protein
MSTTYTHQLATGASRSTGLDTQTLNTVCHIASSEIDNATNKDELLDIVMLITLAATPVAGAPIQVSILYAMDGTNYEDGIPATNDGTAAASPVPNPNALVDSHGVLASANAQKWTIRDIPLLPYKFKIVVYNGTSKSSTDLLTVLAYGRKSETIG